MFDRKKLKLTGSPLKVLTAALALEVYILIIAIPFGVAWLLQPEKRGDL